MALRQSKQVKAGYPVLTPTDANCGSFIVAEYEVETGLALNDVIEMGGIPENCIVAGVKFAFADCDSNGTPTMSFDAGILSGDYGSTDGARTCGAQFLSGDTTARAGGVVTSTVLAGQMLASSDTVRGFGLKVAAAAATLTVGAKIRAILHVLPKRFGAA